MAMAPPPFFISARLMDGTRTGLMGSEAVPHPPRNAVLFIGGGGGRDGALRIGLAEIVVSRFNAAGSLPLFAPILLTCPTPTLLAGSMSDVATMKTVLPNPGDTAAPAGFRAETAARRDREQRMARRSSRSSSAVSAPRKDTSSGTLRIARQPSVARRDIPARAVAAPRAIRRPDEGAPHR